MPDNTTDFFDTKENHPWSRMKDRVLGSYVTAYLGKISSWSSSILVIDAFAGPGKTEDGEPGSPLIISNALKKYAKGKGIAIFVNSRIDYHNQLTSILIAEGHTDYTITMHGDGPTLLSNIAPMLTNQSVFLYIDPFGLECEFDTLEPFLRRDRRLSTDILINLQVPILHRLAGRDAVQGEAIEPDPSVPQWMKQLHLQSLIYN